MKTKMKISQLNIGDSFVEEDGTVYKIIKTNGLCKSTNKLTKFSSAKLVKLTEKTLQKRGGPLPTAPAEDPVPEEISASVPKVSADDLELTYDDYESVPSGEFGE